MRFLALLRFLVSLNPSEYQAWELSVKKQIFAAVKLTPWRERKKIACRKQKSGVQKRRKKEEAPVLVPPVKHMLM